MWIVYPRGHLCRNASELWRPFAECNYSAAALLRRRRAPPLALYVPAAMTGVEGAEDSSIRFMGAKVVALRPAPPRCDRSAAGLAAAAAAAAATARATAMAYQQQAPAPLSLMQRQPDLPAPAPALQTPVAAALAAAKQLAAAAAPILGSLPRGGSGRQVQSMQPSGSGLRRVPRCLDVPLLSPAGSSGSLSVASSSDSFGGVLRQLAAQGSPRSPECCPLPQPSASLLTRGFPPKPGTLALGAPLPPPSQEQLDQRQRQQMCTTGRAGPCCLPACACASVRLQSQLRRVDCSCQHQAPSKWAGLCGHPAQHHVAVP